MLRQITRPSTAHCTLPMYMGFLISEPHFPSCRRLGEVMNISCNSVNRFLERENYTPKDLFDESLNHLHPEGGILSVDDSVLDKPYAQKMELVTHCWSGKHHQTVKGIHLITLYYTDIQGNHSPVNYRIYNKADGKTKNDYFLEMLAEVKTWGLSPSAITGDSWYSGTNNLKAIKNDGISFLFGMKSNRLVSLTKGEFVQIQTLEVPEEGLAVWLRGFGYVKVFRTHLKDQVRHYVLWLPEVEQLQAFTRADFQKIHDTHWQIEQYHRAIKQVCHVEHFQFRRESMIRNHVFASLCCYVQLQRMQASDTIKNVYRLQRELFSALIAEFVSTFANGKEHLESQFNSPVKA